MLHLRNLVGAHYNEWALVLSRDEAVSFAAAVSKLVGATWCSRCQRWIEEIRIASGAEMGWRCKCGALTLAKNVKVATRDLGR